MAFLERLIGTFFTFKFELLHFAKHPRYQHNEVQTTTLTAEIHFKRTGGKRNGRKRSFHSPIFEPRSTREKTTASSLCFLEGRPIFFSCWTCHSTTRLPSSVRTTIWQRTNEGGHFGAFWHRFFPNRESNRGRSTFWILSLQFWGKGPFVACMPARPTTTDSTRRYSPGPKIEWGLRTRPRPFNWGSEFALGQRPNAKTVLSDWDCLIQ